MVRHFDHVTIVVRDVEAAKRFFGLLGFELPSSVVIPGDVFSAYMGGPGLGAGRGTAGRGPAARVQEAPSDAEPDDRESERARVQPRVLRGRRPRRRIEAAA